MSVERWMTENRWLALQALAGFDHIAPREPSAAEVSARAGKPRFWARDHLLWLASFGLVRNRKLGRLLYWRITDKGRLILANKGLSALGEQS